MAFVKLAAASNGAMTFSRERSVIWQPSACFIAVPGEVAQD